MLINETKLGVRPVRAFSDNYIWLIDAPANGKLVVVVDPGEAAPVAAELRRSNQGLAAILLTHHHADHIGGVADLLAATDLLIDGPVPVFGPDDPRIPNLTRKLGDGDRIELSELGLSLQTLFVPGHTLSHIAFFGHGALFCGDTLFSAGCGRLFEGTAAQMSTSLHRLSSLPPETRVYAGHEYTAANLTFALNVDPDNHAARDYSARVAALRANDVPSLPSTIDLENRVNPFLRCGDAAIRAAVATHGGTLLSDPASVFAELRTWKDGFR
jgi:hydroxyacylglutathione hydrolase